MYHMCCWYIITGNVILCYFNFVLLHHLHPCWNILAICERDKGPINPAGFPSLCSYDNALPYLYSYLYFMLIWRWCILYYVWWEAIQLFCILNPESWYNHYWCIGYINTVKSINQYLKAKKWSNSVIIYLASDDNSLRLTHCDLAKISHILKKSFQAYSPQLQISSIFWFKLHGHLFHIVLSLIIHDWIE